MGYVLFDNAVVTSLYKHLFKSYEGTIDVLKLQKVGRPLWAKVFDLTKVESSRTNDFKFGLSFRTDGVAGSFLFEKEVDKSQPAAKKATSSQARSIKELKPGNAECVLCARLEVGELAGSRVL
jgi:hypothetical protein